MKNYPPSLKLLAVFVGLLPYVAGASAALANLSKPSMIVACALTTFFCTAGAFFLRRRSGDESAGQRLIVDPFLYEVEFMFLAAVVHFMFVPH